MTCRSWPVSGRGITRTFTETEYRHQHQISAKSVLWARERLNCGLTTPNSWREFRSCRKRMAPCTGRTPRCSKKPTERCREASKSW